MQPARFLDGVVFGVFIMFISGFSLFMIGAFHNFVTITNAEKLPALVPVALNKILPAGSKTGFVFNLTHVLLTSLVLAVVFSAERLRSAIAQTRR